MEPAIEKCLECDGYFSRDSMNSLLFDWGLAKAGKKVKDIWWEI